MSNRRSPADYERMAQMRERGMGYDAIGKVFGISGKAVSWHCLRLGADPPRPSPLKPEWHAHPPMRRGNHIVRPFTPEEDAKLIELERQGLGDTAIGRIIGRKPNSIRGRLMTLARREERAEAAA